MLQQIRAATAKYPRQFWLIFWGVLVSSVGGSMIWPFMAIYIRQRLDVPITTISLLLTLTSIFSIISSFIAGPIADRVGRKGVMLTSLVFSAGIFFLMSFADSLWLWAVIMIMRGCFNPLYAVGADAMIADLTGREQRSEAYSLIRMINNAGISLGPTIGGFIAGSAFNFTFYVAIAAYLAYAALILLLARETLARVTLSRETLSREAPGRDHPAAIEAPAKIGRPTSGYGPVLRDRVFLAFVGSMTLTIMGAASMFVLLSVYTKENFNLPENQFGLIMAANAAMVVLFQFVTTRFTRRFKPMPVLAIGSLFYVVGLSSVALGRSFPAFLASMVVMTIGELIMMPTGSSLTAELAPPDMRGRYMSIYGLTWGIGVGLGPVITGFLSDNIAPVAMWIGAGGLALLSTLCFTALVLATRGRRAASQTL